MIYKLFDHRCNHPGGPKTKRCLVVAVRKLRSGKRSR